MYTTDTGIQLNLKPHIQKMFILEKLWKHESLVKSNVAKLQNF